MRGASVALAVLALAACAVSEVSEVKPNASGAPDAPDPAEAQAAQDQMAYDIAESLVTEVGPRFAGTEGDRKAVEWALLKLTVLGFDKVRAEPVTAPRWERGAINVELLGPQPQRLEAVALGGSVATPADGIEAAVVAVADAAALEKLPAARVKGRIVFFTARMERQRDKGGYRGAAPTRRRGPDLAARKGAVAVLMRSIGTGTHRLGHTGRVIYEANAPRIPAAALAQADADALEQAAARGTARVRLRLESRQPGEAQSANVIGEIPGATPEIVLLGAHLDSWDLTPGANDDAAGVGIVIAAAHRLAGSRPARTIRVVLFANEEYGATGAKAYAMAHAAEPHVAALEADSGSAPVWRLDAAVAEADWPWVAQLAQGLTLAVGSNGVEGQVDVAELRKYGVPELIATQDASAYFDVHHTAADTVATLDRAGLKQATDVYAALAQAVAERPEAFGRVSVKAPGKK